MIKTIKNTNLLLLILLLLTQGSAMKYQKLANGATKIARTTGRGTTSPHFYRFIRQAMIYLWGR